MRAQRVYHPRSGYHIFARKYIIATTVKEEPMYLISHTTLTSIADAIREQTGETAMLTTAQMPEAIRSLTGDLSSLLPPPVTDVKLTAEDQGVTVSFTPVSPEYEQYLGEPAYLIVLKEGSAPTSPEDGAVLLLSKTGEVIG